MNNDLEGVGFILVYLRVGTEENLINGHRRKNKYCFYIDNLENNE
jgi:hypothetical protein